jgi:hypothetical protein
MQHEHEVFETGDDTYTGFAFTPDEPGCDQVEVTASLDLSTNEESMENIEKAKAYAEELRDMPLKVKGLEESLKESNRHWDSWSRIADHRLGQINRLHATLRTIVGLTDKAEDHEVIHDVAQAGIDQYQHVPSNVRSQDRQDQINLALAAPDLLKAAHDALYAMTHGTPDQSPQIDALRTAIEKALGK